MENGLEDLTYAKWLLCGAPVVQHQGEGAAPTDHGTLPWVNTASLEKEKPFFITASSLATTVPAHVLAVNCAALSLNSTLIYVFGEA